MRNGNLLKVVETYLVALKNQNDDYSSKGNRKRFITAERALYDFMDSVDIDDITEIFTDLRDYWGTLEVSK